MTNSHRFSPISSDISRRSFLAMSAMLPLALRTSTSQSIPSGLELYSVREALKQDLNGTVRAVAKMGYQCVEFYAPYFDWTETQTKDMRKLLDDIGVHCYSTHNNAEYLNKENISRTRDKNHILGCKYVVIASAHLDPGIDGWKAFAGTLNSATEQLEPSGLKAGYHNHKIEWIPIDGVRPMEVLAKETKPTVMLQLDVGTCLEAGSDPVAWIQANPGRIRSLHCKDWSPDPGKGYTVLFGEGIANWKAIFQAAENGGGVEYYLIEQEGSRLSELDTARKCLDSFKAMKAEGRS
jgi:sugar phosphate isomerase/epimerase